MKLDDLVINEDIHDAVARLNRELSGLGIFPIAVVNPKDCIGQQKNARYFEQGKFEQLVKNVKGDGALESAPLLFQNDELKAQGKYEIISGHHRVDAAKAAHLPAIIAFVRYDITREELISKQLSHNSLVGKDDAAILKQLFDSISDIDLRLASGLQDEIEKISYEGLNFKVGTYKAFSILFMPPDYNDYEKVVGEMMSDVNLTGDAEVRIAAIDSHPQFIDAIQRVKKVANIKSNAVALHRILKLAQYGLSKLEEEKATRDEQLKEAKQNEKAPKKAK